MNIRVERKDGAIITIDVTGDPGGDPVELHYLVGQDMQHVFMPEGLLRSLRAETRGSAPDGRALPRCRSFRRRRLRSLRLGALPGRVGILAGPAKPTFRRSAFANRRRFSSRA